jgi:ABC-type transport system involved in multi-copper enzyme maturation permease subunit
MRKYLAIMKDSLRETIDSKVFYLVLVISVLAVFAMATLSLEPNSPKEGLQNLAKRFPDGAMEADLPVIGKVKVTEPTTEYTIQDLKGADDNKKPWDSEYQFTLQSRDVAPLGGRSAILVYILQKEEREEREKGMPAGRKSRWRQLNDEIGEEAQRIQEREENKKREGPARNQRMLEELRAFMAKRLEKELISLKPEEMEEFVREQLENQGNWKVKEVKYLDLPPEEKVIQIERRVVVPVEGEKEVRTKTEKVDGEVNKFAVTVVSRDGTYRVWPHKMSFLFGAMPLGNDWKPGWIVYYISHYGVGWVGAPVIMLLSCIITAFYLPNMLRKGTIDLLLAKPISRVSLMCYKYIGGLTFMFINTSVLIVGLWIALGVRSGIWELAFLWIIPVLTFEFALFYALSCLAAVLTRSPIVCILSCVLLWGLLFGIGLGYRAAKAAEALKGDVVPTWVFTTAEVAHVAMPHYVDCDQLTDKTLKITLTSPSEGELKRINEDYKAFNWPETLLITSIYIVLLVGLTTWRFWAKDY